MEENMLMNQTEAVPGPDSEYQPISTLGYVGIILLMGIPVVGLIFTIVWACGGCKKKNKTNFARAALNLGAISLICTILIGLAVKKVVTGIMESVETISSIGQEFEEMESLLGEDVVIPENLEGLADMGSLLGVDSLGDLQNLDETDIMGIINELDEEELESIAQMLESLGQSIE